MRPTLQRVPLRLLFLFLTLPNAGCVTAIAAQSVGGRAYVVRGNLLCTRVYNCDATGARPTCYLVTEEPLP